MNEPVNRYKPMEVPLTKDNILEHIVECAKIFNEEPIATGTRYVWHPFLEEMVEVEVKK
jgi:hypothetical protein